QVQVELVIRAEECKLPLGVLDQSTIEPRCRVLICFLRGVTGSNRPDPFSNAHALGCLVRFERLALKPTRINPDRHRISAPAACKFLENDRGGSTLQFVPGLSPIRGVPGPSG